MLELIVVCLNLVRLLDMLACSKQYTNPTYRGFGSCTTLQSVKLVKLAGRTRLLCSTVTAIIEEPNDIMVIETANLLSFQTRGEDPL